MGWLDIWQPIVQFISQFQRGFCFYFWRSQTFQNILLPFWTLGLRTSGAMKCWIYKFSIANMLTLVVTLDVSLLLLHHILFLLTPIWPWYKCLKIKVKFPESTKWRSSTVSHRNMTGLTLSCSSSAYPEMTFLFIILNLSENIFLTSFYESERGTSCRCQSKSVGCFLYKVTRSRLHFFLLLM